MTKIEVKPLSVNRAWQGRRFKTKEYKEYEEYVLFLLPNKKIPKNVKLRVRYEFGVNKLSDWDNLVKPFQDILQKKYGFNDRDIMQAITTKVMAQIS